MFILSELMQATYLVPALFVLVAGAVTYLVFGDFGSKKKVTMPEPTKPKEVPVLRNFTTEEIRGFNGADGKPIYVAVNGIVFNMSSHESGPSFYGPGCGYNVFAGRDASVGLGMMQTDPTQWKKATVDELSASERQTMEDWINRFKAKYDIIGALTDGSNPSTVDDLRKRGIVNY